MRVSRLLQLIKSNHYSCAGDMLVNANILSSTQHSFVAWLGPERRCFVCAKDEVYVSPVRLNDLYHVDVCRNHEAHTDICAWNYLPNDMCQWNFRMAFAGKLLLISEFITSSGLPQDIFTAIASICTELPLHICVHDSIYEDISLNVEKLESMSSVDYLDDCYGTSFACDEYANMVDEYQQMAAMRR